MNSVHSKRSRYNSHNIGACRTVGAISQVDAVCTARNLDAACTGCTVYAVGAVGEVTE